MGPLASGGLPLVVFGSLSVVGGFLALPLPETRHRPLPETVDDVEHYEAFCKYQAEHHIAATAAATGGDSPPEYEANAPNGTELSVVGKPVGTNV